jgi:hypothetical protein
MRSTQRFPLSLLVPWLRLRHSTANRIIRSAKLLVGSTPFCQEKKQRFHLLVEPADKSTRFTLAVLAAFAASAAIKDKVDYLLHDFEQFDVLVRIVRLELVKPLAPAGARP